jgi:hypothetical protein
MSVGGVSELSICLHSCATSAACSCVSGAESGLQRLQGRNPAPSAPWQLKKKATFSGRGVREPQEERQYTPVVFTA